MMELNEEQRRNLEDDWGPAAPHSEYKIGNILHYKADGLAWNGTIVWIAAPSESTVEGHDPLPMRYIVEREGWRNSIPDVVYSGDILSADHEKSIVMFCPYCYKTHLKGGEQYCPGNPNNKP